MFAGDGVVVDVSFACVDFNADEGFEEGLDACTVTGVINIVSPTDECVRIRVTVSCSSVMA